MNDKQPEALRLADDFEATKSYLGARAAAEFRRLHEVNAELVKLLKRIKLEQGFICECGIKFETWDLIEEKINDRN